MGLTVKIQNRHTKQVQEIELSIWNEQKDNWGRHFIELKSLKLEDLKENSKPKKALKEEVKESEEKKE